MRLGVVIFLGLLAGCVTNAQGPKELSHTPLYQVPQNTVGLARVSFSSSPSECGAPRFLTGDPQYTSGPGAENTTYVATARHTPGGRYGEAVSCHCYSNVSPKTLTYGNMRMSVLQQIRQTTANELNVTRDAFFNTAGGTRYEFEGSMPYAGTPLIIYAASESWTKCTLTVVAIWDPRAAADASVAMRFIGANSSNAAAQAAPLAQANSAIAERLMELNRLKDAGLITDSEYQEKRKKVLESL